MPRIKLRRQDNYEFLYKKALTVRDINYGGHLGNDAVVTIIHEARLEFLKLLGFTELNLGDGKTGIIMSDLVVNYLDEGFMFDHINVLSHIDEISSASFRIFHNFTKKDKTIVLAETGIIAFDYSLRRVTEIPDVFVKTLENYIKNI